MSMNFDSKTKFGLWIILILVILNAGTLGLLWYEHFQKSQLPPRDGRPKPEDIFIRELNLNQQQAEALILLRDEHFRQVDSVKRVMHHLTMEMIEELFAPIPDTVKVKMMSDKIGKEHAVFEEMNYNHFNKIKELCAPEYHDKLKHLILDAINSQLPGPGARGKDRHPPPLDDDRRPPPREDNRPPPPHQGG